MVPLYAMNLLIAFTSNLDVVKSLTLRILQTGDEASIDAEGYIKITGRIKDLIIRGGENIAPLEVESCLLSYPNVAEVSVVGVPDERYGEAVAAFVVKGGEVSVDEVRGWVRQKLSRQLGQILSPCMLWTAWAN